MLASLTEGKLKNSFAILTLHQGHLPPISHDPHHRTIYSTCQAVLFLTKSKSKPVRITGKHEAGNKPTNSSSFKNQSGRHLSHFLKTPLSISLSFSLSLHHVAASPQMIGATEPCERLSEIGR